MSDGGDSGGGYGQDNDDLIRKIKVIQKKEQEHRQVLERLVTNYLLFYL
jgi:hypothetical protein